MSMLFAEGKGNVASLSPFSSQGRDVTSVECQQLLAGSEAVVPVPLVGVGRQRMQEVF